MPSEPTSSKGRVLLVSAPWPLFNRPSLSLGALKAYLSAKEPHVQTEACHLFLEVAHALGFERYQGVSRRVWRAEAVFSALLYPDRAHLAESLYTSTLKHGDHAPDEFRRLVRQVKTVMDNWLQRINWSAFKLVGFTVSFCQMTASLYLISQIKASCPSLPVVVGGSSFSGERSADLLKVFPYIDYLVVGEGERPLLGLLRQLVNIGSRSAGRLPDGILATETQPEHKVKFSQLSRLGSLPVPDYDDYFNMLAGFSPQRRFFPILPIEASRGCWWHRNDTTGQFKGCAFCNLNLQWQGYRTKPPEQVIREVDHLVRRHQVLSLAFADNAFPINQAASIFDGIRELDRDLSIFAELRANTPPELLRKMKQAGLETVQVGIEALSSRLLAKMNKGFRVIDNLSLMKHCEAMGIINASNLMLHFPDSDDIDVMETLHALEFVRWYRPLKTVSFWLGLESPVYRFARRFHIRSVCNHPNLKKLFPEAVVAGFRFMIQGYRGDRKRQQNLWRSVEKETRQWQKDYDIMVRQTAGIPPLAFRDGGRFIIIDQRFPTQPTVKHRLTGISAEIYRYCHIPRTLAQVAGRFDAHSPEQVAAFFKSMVKKRLMFEENDCYLSLAFPVSWRQ
ncbi:MAG: RiPP maturation radical SAM C-methyltransferase [Deltaproteobacteria bacterium]|nr:RiPP maturation radical SAM C-methyltransferase [Deltaproteobacteria bacterium]